MKMMKQGYSASFGSFRRCVTKYLENGRQSWPQSYINNLLPNLSRSSFPWSLMSLKIFLLFYNLYLVETDDF